MKIEAIDAVVEDVLRSHLAAHGYERSETRLGADHTGEPAIFITAFFRPDAEPTPGKVSGEVVVALLDRLIADGEERFPYISYDYAEPDLEEAPSTSGFGW